MQNERRNTKKENNSREGNRVSQRWSFAMITYPTLFIHILHILQGHTGFHFLIDLTNFDRGNVFISLGIFDQIFGPRWARVSIPQETVLTLKVLKVFSPGYSTRVFRGKIRFMIFGASPYATLYSSIARVWMFLSWTVKDSSFFRSSCVH